MFDQEIFIIPIVPARGFRAGAVKHGYPHRLASSEDNIRILATLDGWRVQAYQPMESLPTYRVDSHGNNRVQRR
jgi:hypothetical protein